MAWRNMRNRRTAAGLAIALILSSGMVACQRARPSRFSVVVPRARRAGPIDGRIMLLFSTDAKGEPRLQMREPRQQISANRNTKQTFQMFGVDIDGLAPETPVTIDASALGFPRESLAQVPVGEYTVQAVLNVYETFHRKDKSVIRAAPDHWEGQVWRTKPGNLYSEPQRVRFDPNAGDTIRI